MTILTEQTQQLTGTDTVTELETQIDQAALVADEIKELKAALKAKEAALSELREPIERVLSAHHADTEKVMMEGAGYVATFTAKTAVNTWTDVPGLKEKLDKISPELFFDICKPSVTEVRKYLGEFGARDFMETAHTGKRRVTFKKK